MNNATGHIRLWEPFHKTGAIFSNDGPRPGLNIAFRFSDVNSPKLQAFLAKQPRFICTNGGEPGCPGIIGVSYLDNGAVFALNIVETHPEQIQDGDVERSEIATEAAVKLPEPAEERDATEAFPGSGEK